MGYYLKHNTVNTIKPIFDTLLEQNDNKLMVLQGKICNYLFQEQMKNKSINCKDKNIKMVISEIY